MLKIKLIIKKETMHRISIYRKLNGNVDRIHNIIVPHDDDLKAMAAVVEYVTISAGASSSTKETIKGVISDKGDIVFDRLDLVFSILKMTRISLSDLLGDEFYNCEIPDEDSVKMAEQLIGLRGNKS